MNKSRRTGEQYYAEIKKIAEDHGGILLSEKWEGRRTKYKFAFSKDNLDEVFEKWAHDLLKHGWPKDKEVYLKKSNTMIQSHKISNEERYLKLKSIIENKGAKLITENWLGINENYEIIDEFGNKSVVYPQRIFNNQWISNNGQVSQPVCTQIFEYLFKEKFVSTKRVLTAKILNRKRPFELDGYCENLNVAFEYQGDPSHWDVNHEKYAIVSERDNIKKQTCEKLGIILVQIPAFINNTYKWTNEYLFNHVKECIVNKFNMINQPIPFSIDEKFQIDYGKIYQANSHLYKAATLAKENNALLITKEWENYRKPLHFKVEGNIDVYISLKYLNTKGWPKDIKVYIKNSSTKYKSDHDFLNDMNELAKKNGAKLVSTIWKGYDYFYEFKTNDDKKLSLKQCNLIKNGWPKNINRHIIKE